MSQAEQVTLRYNYLMKTTKDAQGDFARTQDGFANKWRTLQGRIEEFSKKIGELLLPYVEKAVNFFDDLIVKVTEMFPNLDKAVVIFGLLAVAIGPLLVVVGGLIVAFGGVIGVGTALFGLISTVGMPVILGITAVVLGLSAPIIGLTTYLGATAAVIGVAIVKTGVLQSAFQGLKSIVQILSSVFKGDLKTATDILINKFGMSRQQAKEFITKILVLKRHVILLGNKLKEIAGNALNKFIAQVRRAAKFVYDNRAEIIRFIGKLADLAVRIIKTAKTAYDKFREMKRIVSETMDTAGRKIKGVINFFNKLKNAISGVVNKIGGLKFPSPPKWLTSKIPGFAEGVRDFSGGWAVVGEQGPELVTLPQGSNVFTTKDTRNMVDRVKLNGAISKQNIFYDYSSPTFEIIAKDLDDVMTYREFYNRVKTESKMK